MSAGVLYACKGAHTLFSSQRERERGMERDRGRERERKTERVRERKTERGRKRERITNAD